MVGTRIRLLADSKSDSSIEENYKNVDVPIHPRRSIILTCQQGQRRQQQHNRRLLLLVVTFVNLSYHESWLMVNQQQRHQRRRLLQQPLKHGAYRKPFMLHAISPIDTMSSSSNIKQSTTIIPPTSMQHPVPTTTSAVDTTTVKTAYIHQNQFDDGLTSISITIPPYMKDDDIIVNSINNNMTLSSYPSILHSIHVIQNVLSEKEVRKCLLLAQQYATTTQCWDVPDTQRHLSYSTCDFPIDACSKLQNYLHTIQFDTRIWNILHTLYHVPYDQMYYLDLFCIQYKATTGIEHNNNDDDDNKKKIQAMDQLPLHRDGSILSFTITLNRPNIDFMDGGTCFDALNNVQMVYNDTNNETMFHSNGGIIRPQQNGDAIFHCGKILHGGSKITSGTRIVLVGFVDVLRNDDDDNDDNDVDDEDYYLDDSITIHDDDDDDDNESDENENNIELDNSSSSSTGSSETIVRSNAIFNACRDWGRLDVKQYRYERQEQMIAKIMMEQNYNNNQYDKNSNDDNELLQHKDRIKYYKRMETSKKWIPKHNCFRNICPILYCIKEHNNTHTGNDQRYKRLQIEDELLRSIFV